MKKLKLVHECRPEEVINAVLESVYSRITIAIRRNCQTFEGEIYYLWYSLLHISAFCGGIWGFREETSPPNGSEINPVARWECGRVLGLKVFHVIHKLSVRMYCVKRKKKAIIWICGHGVWQHHFPSDSHVSLLLVKPVL